MSQKSKGRKKKNGKKNKGKEQEAPPKPAATFVWDDSSGDDTTAWRGIDAIKQSWEAGEVPDGRFTGSLRPNKAGVFLKNRKVEGSTLGHVIIKPTHGKVMKNRLWFIIKVDPETNVHTMKILKIGGHSYPGHIEYNNYLDNDDYDNYDNYYESESSLYLDGKPNIDSNHYIDYNRPSLGHGIVDYKYNANNLDSTLMISYGLILGVIMLCLFMLLSCVFGSICGAFIGHYISKNQKRTQSKQDYGSQSDQV